VSDSNGLGLGIHAFVAAQEGADGRDKLGHDGVGQAANGPDSPKVCKPDSNAHHLSLPSREG
jgi:hypothetical protein